MERQTITVDIAPGSGPIQRIRLSQGDIGRQLGVYIIQNGAAVDCSGYSAHLYVLKPDKNYYEKTCSISSNLISWETAEQETPLAGECKAQIRITANGMDIGTANFIEAIEATPAAGGTASESLISSMTQYVDAVEDIISTYSGIPGRVTNAENSLAAAQDGLAIVANGNTHAAIASGQFVYVKNHGSLAEGLYVANSAIGTNATLTTSNLTADGSGGLNALKAKIGNVGNTDLQSQVTSLNSNKIDKPTSVAAGKFLQTDSNGDAVWGNAASPTDVANAVTDWLDDNIPTGQTVAVDQSLTVSGAAADAKVVGGGISDLKSAINAIDDTNILVGATWQQGLWDGLSTFSNNTVNASNLRICTQIELDTPAEQFDIQSASGGKYRVALFDASGNNLTTMGDYSTDDKSFKFDVKIKYIRIVLGLTTDDQISAYNYEAIGFINKNGTLSAIDGKINDVDAEINVLRYGGYYNVPLGYTAGGYISETNGNVISYNGWKYTDYIRVDKSGNGKILVKMYTLAGVETTDGDIYNAFYNTNKQRIAQLKITNQEIEIPGGAVYARLSCRNTYTQKVQLFSKGTVDIPNGSGQFGTTEEYLKFGTWNVGIFSDGTHQPSAVSAPAQIVKLRKAVGKINADILNTQEYIDYVDSDHDFASGDLLKFKYENKVAKDANKCFSKATIESYEVITFTSGSGRACIAYTLEIGGKEITVINAHLSIELNPATYRAADIQQLITYMDTKDYVILSGDFNVASDSEFNAFKTAGYTLCNGGDFGWFDTWPVWDNMWEGFSTDWPCYRLDNIIVSSNIIPQYVETVECDISDHVPLVATFKIN